MRRLWKAPCWHSFRYYAQNPSSLSLCHQTGEKNEAAIINERIASALCQHGERDFWQEIRHIRNNRSASGCVIDGKCTIALTLLVCLLISSETFTQVCAIRCQIDAQILNELSSSLLSNSEPLLSTPINLIKFVWQLAVLNRVNSVATLASVQITSQMLIVL